MAQLGQVAYEAYAYARSWKTFNGDPMPTWDSQQRNIQEAWQKSAEAAVKAAITDQDEALQAIIQVAVANRIRGDSDAVVDQLPLGSTPLELVDDPKGHRRE